MKEIIKIDRSFRIVKVEEKNNIKFIPEMRTAFFLWSSFIDMQKRFGFFYNKNKVEFTNIKDAEKFISSIHN